MFLNKREGNLVESINSKLTNALNIIKNQNLQSGVLILSGGEPCELDPRVPTYIELPLTSNNREKILKLYPSHWEIQLLNGGKVKQGHLTKEILNTSEWEFVHIPAVSWEENYKNMRTLIEVIRKLRAPDGCPWDRAQTHETLAPYLLEETYEVLEEIDNDNSQGIKEELGDILLQVVLHSDIAEESGNFDIFDVIDSLIQKLVFRHPHVFGDDDVETPSDAEEKWESLKSRERQGASIMEGLPKELPALLYAQRIQNRASNVGFDWDNIAEVLDKVLEEVQEYRQATSNEDKTKEFGDIIFTLVNLGRHLKIDVEKSLRSSNNRFVERFKLMEELLKDKGVSIHEIKGQNLDEYWEMSKGIISKREVSD